jgi:nitroimidazol reductase NimA-like FMN-containing flavoprotein (pyridoxamine 5'-phosphate oxidase superfamily)
MRRKDKEITDNLVIESILNESEICRLGLVENGEPYIVPVNFAYSNGALYIHSAMQGRKIEVIKGNNRAAFEMEAHASIKTGPKPCDWTARYRSLMGKGTIEIETDLELKKNALDLIMKKYGWGNEELIYDAPLLARVCILKVNIESLSAKQSGGW